MICLFYFVLQTLCHPMEYKPMLHQDHSEDLRHFRSRSKSWTAGDKRKSLSRLRFWIGVGLVWIITAVVTEHETVADYKQSGSTARPRKWRGKAQAHHHMYDFWTLPEVPASPLTILYKNLPSCISNPSDPLWMCVDDLAVRHTCDIGSVTNSYNYHLVYSSAQSVHVIRG